MSNVERPPRRMDNYEVGYGRPPVATRFKLGNRGNPRGRRKRKKTAGELIEEAMNAKVRIVVDGKPTTMTKQQVIIHNLVNAAARVDHKAINTLFSLKARYHDSSATTIDPAELGLNDQKIIEEFLANSAQATPALMPAESLVGNGGDQPVDGSPAKNEAQPVEGSPEESEPQPIEHSRQNEEGSHEP